MNHKLAPKTLTSPPRTVNRNQLKWMIIAKPTLVLALMLAGKLTVAQQVSVDMPPSSPFTVTIDNDSGIALESVRLKMNGGAVWDIFNNENQLPRYQTEPDVAGNNDGRETDDILLRFNQPLTGPFVKTGDHDRGNPNTIDVTFNFVNLSQSFVTLERQGDSYLAISLEPIAECTESPCPVSVTWQAPTENVDGTPLTDLKGFGIFWGEQSRLGRCAISPPDLADRTCYPMFMDVSDPNATAQPMTLVVTAATEYYLSMVAYKDNPDEPELLISDWSNEVRQRFRPKDAGPPDPSEPLAPFIITLECDGSSGAVTCEVVSP